MNQIVMCCHLSIPILVQIEGPVQVARRSDMDMNGHINNVTYLGWALETVPADVYLNYSLQEVRALLTIAISISKGFQSPACSWYAHVMLPVSLWIGMAKSPSAHKAGMFCR